jgi:hypothetical protein
MARIDHAVELNAPEVFADLGVSGCRSIEIIISLIVEILLTEET